MQKQYTVINGDESFKVTKDWLDNIPRKNKILSLTMLFEGEKLAVEYEDKTVYWQNIHGTWGFPTVIA